MTLFLVSDIPISIDTRHSIVARAAIKAGADIVNDVSGGTYDADMLKTVGELGVPIILTHMRGTPETMQNLTKYSNVVEDVANALMDLSDCAARDHAIHRWMQVVDPGIGFAKDLPQNLMLLRGMGHIRSRNGGLPLLIGTSRKRFIGDISGVTDPGTRDPGSIASFVASICLEEVTESTIRRHSIVRVHAVKECKQASMVMDAILNRKS